MTGLLALGPYHHPVVKIKKSSRKRGFFVVIDVSSVCAIIFLMRRNYFFVLILFVSIVAVLWIRGLVPFSGDFMRAWSEPWKTDNTVRGVPTILHKAIGDDVFRQIYPAKVLSADLLKKGIFPLWNPYNGAGQPLFAIQHDGLINPFTLGFFVWSPDRAWTVLYLGQFAVLALCFMLFASSLGMSAVAVVFSTLAFLFSGYVIANSLFSTFLYGYAGLPLLLWSIDKVIQKRKSGLCMLPISVAWIMLTGFPQLSLYIFLVGASYAVYRARETPNNLIILAGLGIIGLGLSAIQLVPMYELYRNAAISTETSAFIPRNFLVPIQHFISVIVPNIFGNPSTYNYWGPTEYTESASSVGSIALLFAAATMIRPKKHSLPIFFSSVIVVSTLLCLRWWGTEWLYRLPIPVLSTGAPTRVMAMATFALAVLSGLGLDAFMSGKDRRIVMRLTVIVGMLLVAIFGASVLLVRLHVSCNNPVITTCFSIAYRNTLLEVVAFGLVAFVFVMKRKAVPVIAVGIVLIFGLYNAYKFIPFTKSQYVMPSHPLLHMLQSVAPNRVGYLGSTAVIPTDFATHYRFFDTNYYDPLYIKRYGELISYVNTGDRQAGIQRSDVRLVPDASVSADLAFRRERFWDMTATTTLVTRQNDQLTLVARPTALPRAYIVSKVKIVSDSEKELAAIFSSATDVRNTAFVETPIPLAATGSGMVSVVSYEPSRIELSAFARGTALLVLSDTDYPGWKASVDGKETTVYRTNYTFRGVVVPQGSHTIIFYYDPFSFKLGIAISIASLIIWFGIWRMRKILVQ